MVKEIHNWNDPQDVRRHEDRLRHRLQKFGYRLSRGVTTTVNGKILLKPISNRLRGYQVKEMATGVVILGKDHELTLVDVQKFWQEKENEWLAEKQKTKAEHQKQNQKRTRKSLFAWW